MRIKQFIGDLDFKPCFVAYIILSALALKGVIIMVSVYYSSVLFNFGVEDIPMFNIIIYSILKLMFFLMVAKHSKWKKSQFSALILSDAAMCGILVSVFSVYVVEFFSLYLNSANNLSLKSLLIVTGYCLTTLFLFLCGHIAFRVKTTYIDKAQIAKFFIVLLSFVMTIFAFTGQIDFFTRPSFYRNYSSLITAILLAVANAVFLIILALKEGLGRKVSGGLLLSHGSFGVLLVLLTLWAGEFDFFLKVFSMTALILSGQIISHIIVRKKHPNDTMI